MSLPVLSPTDQRIIGALLEKQLTVPASYPLSLNSLRQACNQSSSREPVVDFSEAEIGQAIHSLKDRGLIRLVWAGKGSRVVKYHQLLDELLTTQPGERALLTVLLLRGAQSAGELRARTERLHSFADKDEVADCLAGLAKASPPLVRELPLQRGRQDTRWVHLLGPLPVAISEPTGPDPREAVLAQGPAERDAKVLAGYQAAAHAYGDALLDELTAKPFDVWFLERIVELTEGPILDLGCGAGQIAAFLADAGGEVYGIDASPEMIAQAKANTDLEFSVGRFEQLLRPRNAAAWGTIVAWYSLVHLAPSELPGVLTTVAATLRPGGILALALRTGASIDHRNELFGVEVDLDFVEHSQEEVATALTQAGLEVAEWYVRSPVAAESASPRLYLLARRPG